MGFARVESFGKGVSYMDAIRVKFFFFGDFEVTMDTITLRCNSAYFETIN